ERPIREADIRRDGRHVRFVPQADIDHYSIISSARTSNEGGTVRPSAFAVFMLMTSPNLVGCSTGRSAGLVPLRILSTKPPARRGRSALRGRYTMNSARADPLNR